MAPISLLKVLYTDLQGAAASFIFVFLNAQN